MLPPALRVVARGMVVTHQAFPAKLAAKEWLPSVLLHGAFNLLDIRYEMCPAF